MLSFRNFIKVTPQKVRSLHVGRCFAKVSNLAKNNFESKIKEDLKKKKKKQKDDVSIFITCYNDVESYHQYYRQQQKTKQLTKKDRLKREQKEENFEFKVQDSLYCK